MTFKLWSTSNFNWNKNSDICPKTCFLSRIRSTLQVFYKQFKCAQTTSTKTGKWSVCKV